MPVKAKAGVRVLRRQGVRPEAGALTKTLRHRDVIALIEEIVAGERSAGKDDVAARVALGGQLRDLRAMLAHGEWLEPN